MAGPAAAAGLAAGALAVAGSSADLLAQLNEQPPGWALVPVLVLAWLAVVGLVVAAGTWPAWRAARRPPAAVLRRGDAPRRVRAGAPASLLALGARLATAARGRYAAAVAVLAVCVGVAHADARARLAARAAARRSRDDRQALPADRARSTRSSSPTWRRSRAWRTSPRATRSRWRTPSGSASRCGSSPSRATTRRSRRRRWPRGGGCAGRARRRSALGLADALGLRPGATLAVQLEGAGEVRFRVVGVVRALERDGRIAYVQPDRLLAATRRWAAGAWR